MNMSRQISQALDEEQQAGATSGAIGWPSGDDVEVGHRVKLGKDAATFHKRTEGSTGTVDDVTDTHVNVAMDDPSEKPYKLEQGYIGKGLDYIQHVK